ncbi:MAG: hypothetical protein NTW54_13495 [Bacteroidetes bacterium]|nr:hypothetical protein [Bacteroidota bacterium]
MKRITSISLALLMLAISLKVSIAFHYCGSRLAQSKIVLGNGKASCGMESKKKSCESSSFATVKPSHCCENELSQIVTDDYQPPVSLQHFPFEFLTSSTILNLVSLTPMTTLEGLILYRPPPNLSSVSLAFTSVFLI